ncbi:MAG TPA: diguanylate cyclase [Steroidobacter sp.]|uniref:diguanylate cyclase domain-containing protein n=1 Tax=Steroidobacter sp. TaxID=1978227 RepID=UPI002EDB618B
MMFDRRIRLLLVEDNPGDVRLFAETIKEARAFQFELEHRDTIDKALAFLSASCPDMIVLDLGLPDGGGVDAIQRVQRAAPSVPLVVLTGLDDEAAAIEALHAGAQDYLIKGQMSTSLLIRALRYAFERHGMQMALRKESTLDELTGLANRRGFLMLAEQHAMLAKRTGERFVVVFIDMDRLKPINDTLGHQAGDAAIAEIADALRVCFRESDIIGRLGGDEFALLLPASDGEDSIRERLHQELQRRNLQPDRRYLLSVSVGIVISDPHQPPSVEEMLAQADALMYEEKQKGRPAR